MPRPGEQHLTPDEVDFLVSAMVSESHGDVAGGAREISAHLSGCEQCRTVLAQHRAIQSQFLNLRSSGLPGAGCPEENTWVSLAAGLLSPGDADKAREHGALCSRCGSLMVEALLRASDDLTAEEEKTLSHLGSSDPAWQRRLASKLGGASATSPPSVDIRKSRSLRKWAEFLAWPRVLAAGASVVLLVLGGLWIWNKSQLNSVDRLLGRSYSDHRESALRYPGVPYAPLQQERGASEHRLPEPQALVDANAEIASHLRRNPDDPEWLHEKARADLLEEHSQSAVDVLQGLHGRVPRDTTITADLAMSYFERGQTSAHFSDYKRAEDLWSVILTRDPGNPVALFNKALSVQNQERFGDAVAMWDRYLQQDPAGPWSAEARAWREQALERAK